MNNKNSSQSQSYYMQPEPKPHNPYQDPRNAKYEKYGDQQELEAEIERDAILLYKKKQLEKIEGFEGYFEFMRPDFPSPAYFEGEIYATAAHAYNAARSNEAHIRKRIQKAPTLQEMYNVARTITEQDGWVHKKMKIMEKITRDKFRRSRDLRERLAATQNREILNVLNDKNEENLFWGIVNKQGQNQLGKILENVRQSIHDDSELFQWMQQSFNLIEGRKKLPSINLEVHKDSELIETITLEGKAYYIFGAHQQKCDVLLRHTSISRVHAAFLIDSDLGVVVLDLMSKAGTKVDDKAAEGCIPVQVKSGAKVTFGLSTRTYTIQIDYSKMQKAVEIEKKNLEREMRMLEKLDNPDLDMDTLKSTLGLIKEDTIYVSNLPYSCTAQDLTKLFADCGKILSTRMPENRQTRQNRGFAFITMENEKAARKALNYDRHMFLGRKLKVNKAEKKVEIEEKRLAKQDDTQVKKGRNTEEEKGNDNNRRNRSRERRRSHDQDERRRNRSRSRERDNKRRQQQREDDERRKKKRSQSSSSSSSQSSSSSSSSSASDKSSDIEAVVNPEVAKDIKEDINQQQ